MMLSMHHLTELTMFHLASCSSKNKKDAQRLSCVMFRDGLSLLQFLIYSVSPNIPIISESGLLLNQKHQSLSKS